jgi:hypothetical protein
MIEGICVAIERLGLEAAPPLYLGFSQELGWKCIRMRWFCPQMDGLAY